MLNYVICTVGPWMIWFCYNVDEKKKLMASWDHGLCEVCMFPPCPCGFSPGTTVFSHIPHGCMWGRFVCLHCPGLSARVCDAPCWCASGPVGSVCVAERRQITRTIYPVLWRKRDSTAALSRGDRPDSCLDRLLLLFWAHYIEDGPHLLCRGLLWLVIENKGEGVANYIKEGGYLQM